MNVIVTCTLLLLFLLALKLTQGYSKPSKQHWWRKYLPSFITLNASLVFFIKAHFFSTLYQPIIDMTFFILFLVVSIVSFLTVLVSHRISNIGQ